MNKVIVIGGGAAGLMAALSAAEAGASVLLLEAQRKAGQENLHYRQGPLQCDQRLRARRLYEQGGASNPRFLFSALNAFGPEDMMALLERLGCPVKVERGDRVFPVSEKASDVTRALEKELRRLGVSIRLNTNGFPHFGGKRLQSAVCELEDGTRLEADRVDRGHRRSELSLHRLHGRRLPLDGGAGPHGLSAAAFPDRADLRRGVGFRAYRA